MTRSSSSSSSSSSNIISDVSRRSTYQQSVTSLWQYHQQQLLYLWVFVSECQSIRNDVMSLTVTDNIND